MKHAPAQVAAAAVALGLVVSTGASARAREVQSSQPAWAPDGKRIAFVRGGALFVVNANGTNLHPLRAQGFDPAWSPTGRLVATDGVIVLDLKTHRRRRISWGAFSPDWSPRGRLAYDAGSSEATPARIYVANQDGSHKTLVARPSDGYHGYYDPAWSPDGQRLAFFVNWCCDASVGRRYLGVISQYRGRIARYAVGHAPFDPDWSPNGRKIAFSDGLESVSVLDLRTRRVKRLHPGRHPSWSPDGRKIAFEDDNAIWVMKADGSEPRRVTR